jgi:hypothetical protein
MADIPPSSSSQLNSGLRLGSVHDLVADHPALTESAVRALIYRAKTNGLDKHLYHLGRRVFIDLRGFEKWVRDRQQRQDRK